MSLVKRKKTLYVQDVYLAHSVEKKVKLFNKISVCWLCDFKVTRVWHSKSANRLRSNVGFDCYYEIHSRYTLDTRRLYFRTVRRRLQSFKLIMDRVPRGSCLRGIRRQSVVGPWSCVPSTGTHIVREQFRPVSHTVIPLSLRLLQNVFVKWRWALRRRSEIWLFVPEANWTDVAGEILQITRFTSIRLLVMRKIERTFQNFPKLLTFFRIYNI